MKIIGDRNRRKGKKIKTKKKNKKKPVEGK